MKHHTDLDRLCCMPKNFLGTDRTHKHLPNTHTLLGIKIMWNTLPSLWMHANGVKGRGYDREPPHCDWCEHTHRGPVEVDRDTDEDAGRTWTAWDESSLVSKLLTSSSSTNPSPFLTSTNAQFKSHFCAQQLPTMQLTDSDRCVWGSRSLRKKKVVTVRVFNLFVVAATQLAMSGSTHGTLYLCYACWSMNSLLVSGFGGPTSAWPNNFRSVPK